MCPSETFLHLLKLKGSWHRANILTPLMNLSAYPQCNSTVCNTLIPTKKLVFSFQKPLEHRFSQLARPRKLILSENFRAVTCSEEPLVAGRLPQRTPNSHQRNLGHIHCDRPFQPLRSARRWKHGNDSVLPCALTTGLVEASC